jgi:hypothetical protein
VKAHLYQMKYEDAFEEKSRLDLWYLDWLREIRMLSLAGSLRMENSAQNGVTTVCDRV